MLHMANLATYGFFALTQMLWGVWLGGRGGGGWGGRSGDRWFHCAAIAGFPALEPLQKHMCRSAYK